MVKWKAFSKLWHCYNTNNPVNERQECNLNEVFANCSEEEEIFPLTTPEIAEAQKADIKLKHCLRRNAVLDKGLEVRLIDNTYVVCKDGKMITQSHSKGAQCYGITTTCSTQDTLDLKRQ